MAKDQDNVCWRTNVDKGNYVTNMLTIPPCCPFQHVHTSCWINFGGIGVGDNIEMVDICEECIQAWKAEDHSQLGNRMTCKAILWPVALMVRADDDRVILAIGIQSQRGDSAEGLRW